jgi:hypothetical protein
MPRGGKALQAPLALARRLLGMLRTVIEGAVLPGFDTGQELARGGSVTRERIGADETRGTDRKPLSTWRKNGFAAC